MFFISATIHKKHPLTAFLILNEKNIYFDPPVKKKNKKHSSCGSALAPSCGGMWSLLLLAVEVWLTVSLMVFFFVIDCAFHWILQSFIFHNLKATLCNFSGYTGLIKDKSCCKLTQDSSIKLSRQRVSLPVSCQETIKMNMKLF